MEWNVYTEIDKWTNYHVEGWNSKFAKVVGKHHPNIMVAKHDAAHHITRIIDDFHYFLINAILCPVQLT